MAKKSLLQEAIAEARELRETAIKNAYKTLEENVTPSIKEMLARKLEEDIDLDENEEINEDVNAGFKKVSEPKKTVTEEAEEEKPEDKDDPKDEEPVEKPADDIPAEDGDKDADDAPEEETDVDAAPAEEDKPADDTPLSDITLGDLKDIISQVVAAETEPTPEGNLGADMDAGDVDGMGDEDAPLEGELEADAEDGASPADNALSPEEEEDSDEIDLSELLKELESEESKDPRGKYTRGGVGCQDRECKCGVEECAEQDPGKGKEFEKLQEENRNLKAELAEAYGTIDSLRNTIAETNLLNSKLQYTSKLLNKNLSESQKARVIKSLDEAKSIKEAKVIYKTLCESLLAQPSKNITLREHRGTASRAAGNSTASKQVISESNDWVRRMQQLAGIIK